MNKILTWALVGLAVAALVFFMQWRTAQALVKSTQQRLRVEAEARERAQRGTARIIDYTEARAAQEDARASRVGRVIEVAKAEADGASAAIAAARNSTDATAAANAYKAWAATQGKP